MFSRAAFTLAAALTVMSLPQALPAQLFDIPPFAADTARPPFVPRDVAVLPGALLPGYRIVAYYGNPKSTRMGALGTLPPEQMMQRLEGVAREWAKADTTRGVMPALHLITTVAQASGGADGMYRVRHPDAQIADVVSWAEKRGWIVFLDVQIGRSTVKAELERLVPWLKHPAVHLALDPEFSMPAGQVPGKKNGTMDAREVNYSINLLSKLVQENNLPPKILVVHRWTNDMLTNHRSIITSDPRVQVVINFDGFGTPGGKKGVFNAVLATKQVQFAGFKLFYVNDKPMMSMKDVLALRPTPIYIQYQ